VKYLRIIMLALATTVVVSAAAATSASAAKYGFFKDETSEPAIGYKYSGKLTEGEAELVTPKNGTIKCKKATGSGEIISENDGEGEIIFKECSFEGLACNSSGAASGEIVSKEITILAVLEILSGGTKQPALLFKPLKETKLECTSLEKLTITNSTGTGVLGGLLVLLPKAAEEGKGWLGVENSEKKWLYDLEFKQKEGKQEGSGEFKESETGELMKAGLTTTGTGLKAFKEESAEGAKLSLIFEKRISIFA